MTETVDSTATSTDEANADENEASADEPDAKADENEATADEPTSRGRSVTELLEQLGRDLSGLALSEAELETARHSAEVKRAARNLAVLAVIGVGFLAAFAFLNVAAFSGLVDLSVAVALGARARGCVACHRRSCLGRRGRAYSSLAALARLHGEADRGDR